MVFHVAPPSSECRSEPPFADSHSSRPSPVPVIDQGYVVSGRGLRFQDKPPSVDLISGPSLPTIQMIVPSLDVKIPSRSATIVSSPACKVSLAHCLPPSTER